MGIPGFIPTRPVMPVRTYESPPRRAESWVADRPGDLDGRQPSGDRLGSQGPDQGYALALAEDLRDQLQLHPGENADDALAGIVAVGLKRASLYGRAPVMYDLVAAMHVWGFHDRNAPKELVALRHRLFEEVHHPHHYTKLREVADRVPADVLLQPHDAIGEQAHDNWKSVIDTSAA